MIQKIPISLNSSIAFYFSSILDRLDISESTKTDYQSRLNGFIYFIDNEGFNRDCFINYKKYLGRRNDVGVSTKNKQLTVARIVLKELHRLGYISVDITCNVKSFKQSRKHKVVGVSNDEVKRIVKYMQQLPTSYKNSRIKAILVLLIIQGLRQIEVKRLDVSDIDLFSKTALIRGKGRDDKELIDLHPITVKVIKEYLKVSRIADGALFVSDSNRSKNTRLTTRSIRRLVKDVYSAVGIEKTTHGLRHYFTTQLIKSYKSDLLEVARYTRHRSLEMLQVYDDSVKRRQDLPRYYEVFSNFSL